MIMKDIKNKIHELIESVYRMGYEDGKNLKYDLGLNDAWECAKKIYFLSAGEIINIFGGCSTWVNYSASEAIAKIKEYEEKQKQEEIGCKTCAYSEHGEDGFFKCHAKGDCLNHEKWASKMTLDEAIKHCEEVADSKCDECGSEHRQLAEWLRELKRLKGEE